MQEMEDKLEKVAQLMEVLDDGENKRGTELLALIRRQLKRKAVVVSAVQNEIEWKLGEPSPTNKAYLVWAMVHWELFGRVVVYGVKLTPGENETMQIDFQQEVLFKPDHIYGPMSAEAMIAELTTFLTADDDDEEPDEPATPTRANGQA